jgi:DnaK suppressor protein
MPATSLSSTASKERVILPKGYQPTEKEKYMNPNQLEYFRQKLLAWRDELLKESRETMEHIKEENWQEADVVDRASIETDTGVELRSRNRYLKLITKIDEALRRIDQGEYGYCEETGDPIGIRRLEARPVATLTVEAQERRERLEKQYSDEE